MHTDREDSAVRLYVREGNIVLQKKVCFGFVDTASHLNSQFHSM